MPTTTSPLGVHATTDGSVRSPPADARIFGVPLSSSTATHELVVPRSMPITRDIALFLLPQQPGQETLAFVRRLPPHVGELARGALVRRIELEHGLEPLRRLEPVLARERTQALGELDPGARDPIAGVLLERHPAQRERLVVLALVEQRVERALIEILAVAAAEVGARLRRAARAERGRLGRRARR